MLTTFSKWILFFTSYIPMFVCLMINSFFSYTEEFPNSTLKTFIKSDVLTIYHKVILFCLIISFVSLLLYLILYFAKKRTTNQKNIEKTQHYNESVLNYMFVYIVPFIYTEVNEKNIILLIIFILIVGSIQVKSDAVYINPTLYLFGYNTYKINDSEILISKHSVEDIRNKKLLYNTDISRLRCIQLFENVYVDCDKFKRKK